MRCHPRRRAISAFVVTAVLVVAGLPGIAAGAAGFGDVASGEYYSDAVAWMVDEEITTGIEAGCFGPDEAVTRGQTAAFLHRLDTSLGNEPRTSAHPFDDVTSAYQDAPVGWLYASGVTTGTGPRTFSPSAPITRGDFAVMLWRYGGRPQAPQPHGFLDVTKGYQDPAIAWMARADITTGTAPTTFDPEGFVTRAQAATFLHRYAGEPAASPIEDSIECSREMRLALIAGGLTPAEAACAAPQLGDWPIEYLIAILGDHADASQDWDLLATVAQIARRCLTDERIAELTRLFL